MTVVAAAMRTVVASRGPGKTVWFTLLVTYQLGNVETLINLSKSVSKSMM